MKAGVIMVLFAMTGCTDEKVTLTVSGTIKTLVTSSPKGIECDGSQLTACTADFAVGTRVRLMFEAPSDTGACPIYVCAAGPAEAELAANCAEIAMDVPVTAWFQCAAP